MSVFCTRIYPSPSSAVHFRIPHTAYTAVTTSVSGMANHKLSAPSSAASTTENTTDAVKA